MIVQGNGSTLAVIHKATVPRYKQDVWFRKDSITTMIALKNLFKKYWFTYDSIDQIFVAHREDKKKTEVQDAWIWNPLLESNW